MQKASSQLRDLSAPDGAGAASGDPRSLRLSGEMTRGISPALNHEKGRSAGTILRVSAWCGCLASFSATPAPSWGQGLVLLLCYRLKVSLLARRRAGVGGCARRGRDGLTLAPASHRPPGPTWNKVYPASSLLNEVRLLFGIRNFNQTRQ